MPDIVVEKLLIFAKTCEGGSFLGLPKWYKYLDGEGTGADCTPVINGINDIWLIVMAIIEILLRIVILVAIGFVLYGGIKFITSRGNPDKINSARNTLQDALVGIIIGVVATALVSFIAGRF
jgi:hypothetical protein